MQTSCPFAFFLRQLLMVLSLSGLLVPSLEENQLCFKMAKAAPFIPLNGNWLSAIWNANWVHRLRS